MPELSIQNREEMRAWAREQAVHLIRPCVVLLRGNLGAGKTQLVRWFCEALGVREAASPTFAIHHEYLSPGGPIDHVDLYRVTSDGDLEASGFWDLLRAPQGLVFVEWSERLPDEVWPAEWMKMTIDLQKPEGAEENRRLSWQIRRP